VHRALCPGPDHPHARGENAFSRITARSGRGPSPRTWGERTELVNLRWDQRTIPTHVGRTFGWVTRGSRRPDHPHARGENSPHRCRSSGAPGPSPRTWGERTTDVVDVHEQRTIPTHVGRTVLSAGSSISSADHPHARGENPVPYPAARLVGGPSPRTWGELLGIPPELFEGRTIPTHVGRTVQSRSARDRTPDHPHARGENPSSWPITVRAAGPSPRTWGERQVQRRDVGGPRTIPTHVGRTKKEGILLRPQSDHPHARGENAVLHEHIHLAVGPSPRTWGELAARVLLAMEVRTIPTHVGRTVGCTWRGRRTPDHPHARGENENRQPTTTSVSGPSPRTWGERPVDIGRGLRARTIPTHVGRTLVWNLHCGKWTDHPHARGENFCKNLERAGVSGPSPRTWGEPPPGLPTAPWPRTIPTHVGRTTTKSTARPRSPDHPHARGENHKDCGRVPANPGPSPRTWGEPSARRSCWSRPRTIPTHVGRTRSMLVVLNPRADHPHARGENCSRMRSSSGVFGPSPRTWGELMVGLLALHAVRTIPTHVGRTFEPALKTRG